MMLDVVDEDLGIPLYQLTATANLVDIDNRNHHLGHMKAAVSLSEVTIHYFNWYKEINETLLEPWNLQVKIMRHPRLPTKIVLQSSGKMELNLTRPFLEMTSRVLSEQKWITDDSSTLPSSSLSSSSENRYIPHRHHHITLRSHNQASFVHFAAAGWPLSRPLFVPSTR